VGAGRLASVGGGRGGGLMGACGRDLHTPIPDKIRIPPNKARRHWRTRELSEGISIWKALSPPPTTAAITHATPKRIKVIPKFSIDTPHP
jgi:hypothetical protein